MKHYDITHLLLTAVLAELSPWPWMWVVAGAAILAHALVRHRRDRLRREAFKRRIEEGGATLIMTDEVSS